MHNSSTVATLPTLIPIHGGEMNDQIQSAQGINWSYDSAVGIITILDATGRVVDQGWSICDRLESVQPDPSTDLIKFIGAHSEMRQIPCDAMTAVRLFLAGTLTLDHLTQPENERKRTIVCRDVKVGPYKQTLVIVP
jgi:hypothetical protein